MTFAIPGDPVGKARPRFSGHAYTPDKTKAYEDRVRWAYRAAHGPTFDGPVKLRIVARYRIPKSAPKKTREAMDAGRIAPTKRPDLDNVCKIIMDALNGMAYADDAQVCEITAGKSYAVEPRVTVQIEGRSENGSI